MGSWTFETYADGADPTAAFHAARSDAEHEHGYGGYSGTIAEKDDYVVITHTLMDLDQAQALAADLIGRGDARITDKWGPAGAIPVWQRTRTVTVDKLSGTATAGTLDQPELDRIAGIARERGVLTTGETVTAGRLITARRHRTGKRVSYTDGIAELTVTKSPAALRTQTRPDGWLFFGWASS